MLPHDRLIAANGEQLTHLDWDSDQFVSRLRGPKGSVVELDVVRHDRDSMIRLEVTRDKIPIPSAVASYMLDDHTGYIKLNNFSATTYKEFMQNLEILVEEDSMKHLVLDLRDNPGGYLKEAVNILSQLFPERGKLLVYTEGDNVKRMEYKSTGNPFYPVDNVAVLINEGSASASEIIAGAIQDHDRGVIIGTKSYGKGLVQEQYHLEDGGALRLTTARYYTPSGRSIQKPYVNGYAHDDTTAAEGHDSSYATEGGRPVYAEGGITPDFKVESHLHWEKEGDLFLNYDRLLEFMFYAFTDNYEEGSSDLDAYLAGLPSKDELFASVAEYFELSTDSSEYASAREDWETAYVMVQAMAASYRIGDEAWFKVVNAEDPVIQRALEVVQGDIRATLNLEMDQF